MRVWDVHVKHLCRKHLLGEHRELHGLWNILTKHGGRGGYSRHPETLRWHGKLKALYNRHEELVKEIQRRNYKHLSPLDPKLATGSGSQKVFINTVVEQKEILRRKPCDCFMHKKTTLVRVVFYFLQMILVVATNIIDTTSVGSFVEPSPVPLGGE